MKLKKKTKKTCRPTVMLNKAISFTPALRGMGVLNLKDGTVPFPDPVAEEEHKLGYFS